MLHDSILHEVRDSFKSIEHDFFRGKSVLLTGSTGVIGTYILAYLASLNQAGFGIKIFSVSHSKPPAYIDSLIELGSATHLSLDLTKFSDYQQIPKVDVIIHAAGYAQPSLFMSNPAATLAINVAATLALLNAMDSNGSFIYLSSSEVYCGSKADLCNEGDCGITTPYHPRASYIEGKRAGEAVCAAFRQKGYRTISIRLGDIYGPGTRKHDLRALNSFIEQALTKKEISLRDQGRAMRTYCYTPDAVESILHILTTGKEQVYNVGGPTFTSIRELALTIGNLANVPVKFPVIDNEIAGAPTALNIDMTRLLTEFNKTSYITLEEGLRRTIDWQRSLYA